jgi:origin recognition complex subunit 4
MSSFISRGIRSLIGGARPEVQEVKTGVKRRRADSDVFEFVGSDEEGIGGTDRENAVNGQEKDKTRESVKSSVAKRAKKNTQVLKTPNDTIRGKGRLGRKPGVQSSPMKKARMESDEEEEDGRRSARVKRVTARVDPRPEQRERPVEESDENGDDEDEDIRRSSRARKPTLKVLEESQQNTPKSAEKPVKSASGRKILEARPVNGNARRKPGRPKKPVEESESEVEVEVQTPSKRRGRPPSATPSKFKPAEVKRVNSTPKTLKSSRKEIRSDLMEVDDTPSRSVVRKNLFPQSRCQEQHLDLDKDIFQPQLAVTKPLKKLKPVKWATNQPEIFQSVVSIAFQKLTQRRPTPLAHVSEECSKVHNLLQATVTAGEGNSMLLIGARGSGKTTLVNQVLSELGKTQKKDFHIVRLNGFIQTDDKLALKEIWRQLGKEMEIDEEGGKSYSDTLTMLLALLSHPDEIAGESKGEVATSVVFVMEEFDLFATHARQTLLYNLLDIAQSRKAPIAVLGLTTKHDVTESLEKRVKSRFSHRYVYMPLARSVPSFVEMCMASMMLKPEELSFEEKAQLLSGNKKNDYLADWNDAVQALFADQDFLESYILPTFYLSKSVPTVLTSLLLPLSSNLGNPSTCLLPIDIFIDESTIPSLAQPPSSLPLLLPSLSDLQLALLIAACRLDIIHDSDTCSFGMAYAEYVDLSSKARLNSAAAGAMATGAGTRVWGREVARGEWEVLVKLGLLVPVAEGAGSGFAGLVGAVTMGGLVRVDVKLEEIPGAVPGMSGTMERWCRQI